MDAGFGVAQQRVRQRESGVKCTTVESVLMLKEAFVYCPFCGKQRDTDGSFCAYCGKLVESTSARSRTETASSSAPIECSPASPPAGQSNFSRSEAEVACADTSSSEPGFAATGHAAPWTCPRCQLVNTPGSGRCDCGFSLQSPKDDQSPRTLRPSPPRPWLRYWARWVDSFVAVQTFGFLFALFGLDVSRWNILVTLAGIYLWIPFEAAFLSSSRTTPGKYLFNIRVTDGSGGRLQYGTCLRRSMLVVLKGLGLNIPIVMLFTQISSYRALQNHGITSWDSDCGAVVQHANIGEGRVLAIIATFVLMLLLIGLAGR